MNTRLLFHWFGHDPKLRRLEIEASNAGFVDGKEPMVMFDTAVGGQRAAGIEIHNRRSGNTVRFLLARRVKDSEGAIESWHFTPHPATLAQHPALKGYEVVILRDEPEDATASQTSKPRPAPTSSVFVR